jgi:hypothetical protein
MIDYTLRRLPGAEETDGGSALHSSILPQGMLFVIRRVVFTQLAQCFDVNCSDAMFGICLALLTTSWRKFLRNFFVRFT